MKNALCVLFIVLCSVFGFAQPGIYDEYDMDIQGKFMEAQILKYTGKLDKQIDLLKEIIKMEPECHAAMYELGLIYQKQEDREAAKKYAIKAYETSDKQWYGLLLAEIYEEEYEYEKSESLFTALVNKYPENTSLYHRLAHLQLMNGKGDNAIATYNKLENYEGITETTTRRKFDIYSNMDMKKEAINELQKLIHKNPTNTRYLNNLAGYYNEIGMAKEAEEIFQKVLKIDPMDSTANLAMIKDNPDQAKDEHYLNAITPLIENESIPIDAKVKELIPYISKMPADPNDAKNLALLSNAETLVQKYPKEAKAHSLVADIYYNLGKSNNALKHYKKAIELNDNIFSIWKQCLATLYEIGDFASLESYSLNALDLFPNQFDVYFFRGIALSALNMNNDYAELMSEANFVAGKSKSNLIKLAAVNAYADMENSKLDKAKAHFDNLDLEIQNFPYVNEIYGDIFAKMNKVDEALKYWKRAYMEGNRSPILEEKIAQKKLIE